MGITDCRIIQGGMGVGVSGWRLARAVSERGELGVVSGTAIDAVHARLLQDGDPGGHLQRAYAELPLPGVGERVLRRWYRSARRPPGRPYRAHPMLTLDLDVAHLELLVAANFAEVWLAKEGHDGLVGVNHLEKIQMAIGPSLYGALLADVDAVLMGAGIPSAIPRVLDRLADGEAVDVHVDGVDVPRGDELVSRFDPASVGPATAARRPPFLAIVSSVSLARFLARDDATRPDGFVVEAPVAGGHNAPPRGRQHRDARGEPVYGPRDEVDVAAIAALGLPFWLAGGRASRDGLAEARAAGACGVQVGSAFALAEESGISDVLRRQLLTGVTDDAVAVRTDPDASPSGFPFKVAEVPGTIGDRPVRDARRRVCDLGYLRVPVVSADGSVEYRCPSEPVGAYLRKGGAVDDTEGRACLCNGLTATIGLGQVRRDGAEPALLTLGAATEEVAALAARHGGAYTAADVLDALLS